MGGRVVEGTGLEMRALQELTGESEAQGCNFTVMHGN